MAKQGFVSKHFTDQQGRPAGGTTYGTGFAIAWQHGPLGRHADGCVSSGPKPHTCVEGCTRVPPNGAFVDDVIEAVIDRLKFYQGSPFACHENELVIDDLLHATAVLRARTASREVRKVEGTHAT